MKKILIPFILILALGCNKDNESQKQVVDTGKQTNLDFDNDGKDDLNLLLGNTGTLDVPQSSGFDSYYVTSADTNLSFLSNTVSLDDYWFEENKNVNIDKNSYISNKYFYAPLYKRNITDGNYSSDWTIYGEFISKKTIVFIDKRSSIEKYGWMRLKFDITTKKLSLIDFFETTSNTFTTGKK